MHRSTTSPGSAPTTKLRAVLLDLDGTLYHQPPLRWRMLRELLLLPITTLAPLESTRVWRRIKTYRHVREELRELGRPEESLDELQYEEPARRLGEPVELVRATVREWIEERPLKHLAPFVRAGAAELFADLRARGLEVGVFSDYPVGAKLAALGLRAHVTLELCATDRAINAFKPHPAGFLHACREWGMDPREVLYVGDRVEVDAAGAAAAGMECVICERGPAPEYARSKSSGNAWIDAVRQRAELA